MDDWWFNQEWYFFSISQRTMHHVIQHQFFLLWCHCLMICYVVYGDDLAMGVIQNYKLGTCHYNIVIKAKDMLTVKFDKNISKWNETNLTNPKQGDSMLMQFGN